MASVLFKVVLQFSGIRLKDPIRDGELGLAYLQIADQFLNSHGFVASVISFSSNQSPFALKTVRGTCIFLVFPINPKGWDNESLLQRNALNGEIKYVTRLGYSDSLPIFYTSLDLYATYVLQNLGVKRSDPMVFAVLPQTPCDLRDVDWSRLYNS